MHHAETREIGLREPGQRSEDPALLRPAEIGLEADQVVQLGRGVLLPELDDRPRAAAGPRILEPERLQRPEAERLRSAPRDLLDRQAALEPHGPLEVLQLDLLATHELADEVLVLLAVERCVPVVPLSLVVAGPAEQRLVVDRLLEDDRRGG